MQQHCSAAGLDLDPSHNIRNCLSLPDNLSSTCDGLCRDVGTPLGREHGRHRVAYAPAAQLMLSCAN